MLNINEKLNELASCWYCLSELKKSSLTLAEAEETSIKQQQAEQELIPMLKQAQASKGSPYEAYLEGDTFVDLWLNERGNIENSGHYSRPAHQ
ncbi:hypothetical protein D3C87_1498450 [compost metagenome]